MHQLLDADLWFGLLVEDAIDWQATMFQPIGGMDQIPMAFGRKLKDVIRYGSAVKQIRQSSEGVHVVYQDLKSGNTQSIDASYCVCAMPLTILKTLDTDFVPEIKSVVDGSTYASAYKIAWESPRFWEKEYNIYGGISYLHEAPVGIVWYSSAKLFSENGIIVSGYDDELGSPFGRLPGMAAKLEASRNSVELLHPGHGKDLTKPVYVNWGKVPNNLGSWISGYGGGDKGYERLCAGDRRVFFAGDHLSKIVGWQEGAAVAAHRAVNMIGMQVSKEGANV
jgi:monoamine oxidase